MALSQNSNLLTTSKVTKEALMQLVNNMVVASKADWSYSKEFGKEVEMIGDTLSIRRPVLSTVREDSMTWVGNLPYEGRVQLVIEKSFGADFKFNDADLALKIENFSDRFIKAGVVMVANKIDSYVYGKVINGTSNTVGQYGTAITSDTILAAKELLDSYNCPDDGEIYGVLTPRHNRNLSNAQLTLFNAQKAISEVYMKGRIGEFAGVEFAWSNSSPTHTDGTVWTGSTAALVVSAQSPLTSGWAETSTVTATGFTAGRTINAGDVFTLSGAAGSVKAYNPLTKAMLPFDQQFVVVTAVATTTSAQSITISPAFITDGDYKNIDGNVNASVNLVKYSDTSATVGQESIIFHKKAIAVASPDLVLPNNRDQGWKETDDETGAKIRYLRAFDFSGAFFGSRIDSFIGAKLLRPEWCARIR